MTRTEGFRGRAVESMDDAAVPASMPVDPQAATDTARQHSGNVHKSTRSTTRRNTCHGRHGHGHGHGHGHANKDQSNSSSSGKRGRETTKTPGNDSSNEDRSSNKGKGKGKAPRRRLGPRRLTVLRAAYLEAVRHSRILEEQQAQAAAAQAAPAQNERGPINIYGDSRSSRSGSSSSSGVTHANKRSRGVGPLGCPPSPSWPPRGSAGASAGAAAGATGATGAGVPALSAFASGCQEAPAAANGASATAASSTPRASAIPITARLLSPATTTTAATATSTRTSSSTHHSHHSRRCDSSPTTTTTTTTSTDAAAADAAVASSPSSPPNSNHTPTFANPFSLFPELDRLPPPERWCAQEPGPVPAVPNPSVTLDAQSPTVAASAPGDGARPPAAQPTRTSERLHFADLCDDDVSLPDFSWDSPAEQERLIYQHPDMASGGTLDASMGRPRQDSFVSTGPRPISTNNQNYDVGLNRRESLAGSLMNGLSWGGVSFGSFVRDDFTVQGAPSSFGGGGNQPTSFQSGSYLPKLEANFMRDFTCCGKVLPTLHDLLHHYEEAHTGTSPNAARNNSIAQFSPMGMQGAAMQGSRTSPTTPGQTTAHPSPTNMGHQTAGAAGMSIMAGDLRNGGMDDGQMNLGMGGNLHDDMDTVGDMEMDDTIGTMELDDSQRMHQTRHMFGQQQRPQLHMDTGGITQGLRASQPTTPAAASFGFQHNPTVSSVNTPTLSTQQQQMLSQGQHANDVDEMEEDLPGMPMGGGSNGDIGDVGFGGQAGAAGSNGANADSNFCIDDPGKHLFSPNGAFAQNGNRSIQAQLAQLGLTQAQLNDPEANQSLMNRLKAMMMAEEHKPFKCPVIGCEKAYKNQNGLKYHKSHGHQTQQLHENGDGTFSIVNPETSAPYPGTLGMEKEKPFNCDVCGKRYKNLNGLKYHKAHSLPCHPDLKMQLSQLGVQGNIDPSAQPPQGQ